MGLPGEQRVARAPFPLTPALSLWEREQHLPRWLQVHGAGCANQRSKMVHPLPKGEGRGEGEGTGKKSHSRSSWKKILPKRNFGLWIHEPAEARRWTEREPSRLAAHRRRERWASFLTQGFARAAGRDGPRSNRGWGTAWSIRPCAQGASDRKFRGDLPY